jgi:hypothetical protein
MEAFGIDSKGMLGFGQIVFLIKFWRSEMRIFWDAEICELLPLLNVRFNNNNQW